MVVGCARNITKVCDGKTEVGRSISWTLVSTLSGWQSCYLKPLFWGSATRQQLLLEEPLHVWIALSVHHGPVVLWLTPPVCTQHAIRL